MSKQIGILTAGGDTPGLNAAIRAIGKTGQNVYGMQLIGFYDGFRGLMENRTVRLTEAGALSGLLTVGGTILGTSRDKPNKMPVGGKTLDMTAVMVDNYQKHHLDMLVCLGGGGTNKNAYHLYKNGLNIITLPKTIDNDIYGTEISFGYDTALTIATEAIDRLHSTAHSHHRIIVVEIMGHNTGWLALGAGIAGGADVILIPEIPYNIQVVADAINRRARGGKRFSIVAVSEGALSAEMATQLNEAQHALESAKDDPEAKAAAREHLAALERERLEGTKHLTAQLEQRTGLESRVTILGHVQRGGVPSPADRLLATRLGSACVHYIAEGKSGVMMAIRNNEITPVPLEEVVGKRKEVPQDHPWIKTAQDLDVCMGIA
jgi:6-phosphofructokinase 1